MINNDDDEIKIGSRVKFIDKLQNFNGILNIDTTNIKGTVVKDGDTDYYKLGECQVKFDDDSFLPSNLRGWGAWLIRRKYLELV